MVFSNFTRRTCEVIDQAHKTQQHPQPERETREGRHNPVNVLAGTPAKPEERAREHRPPDARQWQPTGLLVEGPGLVLRFRFDEDVVVPDEDGACDQGPDADCEG